jgi:hypothetical protein
MKIEINDDNWTIDFVKDNKDKIFVFTDNNLRIGKVGQSIIRDLPNTKGIRTKKGPSDKPVAFYSDSEFEQNIYNIREDILDLKSELLNGKKVVFSKNGYGVGTSQIEKVAPRTFFKFCQLLIGHFGFDNITGTLRRRVPGYDEIMAGTYISLDNKKFESNVLTPVNNSYFKKEYLATNLNTLYDLVTKGKKLAFTYPINHNLGDIVIFSVKNSNKYLVCRVVDSYNYKDISSKMWSLFEGYESSYIDTLQLANNGQNLYQNHIDFICTLDEEGKMEFNQQLFGDQKMQKPKETKVVGQTLTNPVDVIIPEGFKKLLKKNNLEGEIVKFPDSEKDYKVFKREKYQVQVEDTFYAIEYIKYPIWDSIKILLTSKNSFL